MADAFDGCALNRLRAAYRLATARPCCPAYALALRPLSAWRSTCSRQNSRRSAWVGIGVVSASTLETSPSTPSCCRSIRGSRSAYDALRYLDNHWEGLTAFAHDGRIEIDTNLVENEIRPFAVGRSNWKFADTPAGATASAGPYTLIVNAKLDGLDPYAYLVHVATAMPLATTVEDFEALLPWNLTP